MQQLSLEQQDAGACALLLMELDGKEGDDVIEGALEHLQATHPDVIALAKKDKAAAFRFAFDMLSEGAWQKRQAHLDAAQLAEPKERKITAMSMLSVARAIKLTKREQHHDAAAAIVEKYPELKAAAGDGCAFYALSRALAVVQLATKGPA